MKSQRCHEYRIFTLSPPPPLCLTKGMRCNTMQKKSAPRTPRRTRHPLDVVIFHSGCKDGWMSALAHHLAHPTKNYQLLQLKAGASVAELVFLDEFVAGNNLVFLDVLPCQEYRHNQLGRAHSVLFIDHHQGFDGTNPHAHHRYIVDTGKSACMLAYEYYGVAPELFRKFELTCDYDLGRFDRESVREYAAGLDEILQCHCIQSEIFDALVHTSVDDVVARGRAVLAMREQDTVRYCEQALWRTRLGTDTHVFRVVRMDPHHHSLTNDVAERILNGDQSVFDGCAPGVVLVFPHNHDMRLSVRVREGDLVKILRDFGAKWGRAGGGHMNAAGIELPLHADLDLY